jgi:hypothetical protein
MPLTSSRISMSLKGGKLPEANCRQNELGAQKTSSSAIGKSKLCYKRAMSLPTTKAKNEQFNTPQKLRPSDEISIGGFQPPT